MPRLVTGLLGITLITLSSCSRPSPESSDANDGQQQKDKRIAELETQNAELRQGQRRQRSRDAQSSPQQASGEKVRTDATQTADKRSPQHNTEHKQHPAKRRDGDHRHGRDRKHPETGHGVQSSSRKATDRHGQPRTGTAIGVLAKKRTNEIYVQSFGEENPRRYVPLWKGGAPAQGGGLDQQMLKVFHDLKVGSHVEVQWLFDERLRAVKVKVLAPGKDHAKHNAGHGGKPGSRKAAAKSREPVRPSGTVIGVIQKFPAARGGVRVEVLAPGEKKARVYWASERQQRNIVRAVRQAKVGAMVEIGWVQTGHGPALTRFKVLEPAKGRTKPAADHGGKPESPKAAGKSSELERQTGTIIGVIKDKQNKGNNVQVAILAPGEQKPRTYHVMYDPRVKGPNRIVLTAVRKAKVGAMVEIGWVQTGHGPALKTFKVLE